MRSRTQGAPDRMPLLPGSGECDTARSGRRSSSPSVRPARLPPCGDGRRHDKPRRGEPGGVVIARFRSAVPRSPRSRDRPPAGWRDAAPPSDPADRAEEHRQAWDQHPAAACQLDSSFRSHIVLQGAKPRPSGAFRLSRNGRIFSGAAGMVSRGLAPPARGPAASDPIRAVSAWCSDPSASFPRPQPKPHGSSCHETRDIASAAPGRPAR